MESIYNQKLGDESRDKATRHASANLEDFAKDNESTVEDMFEFYCITTCTC